MSVTLSVNPRFACTSSNLAMRASSWSVYICHVGVVMDYTKSALQVLGIDSYI